MIFRTASSAVGASRTSSIAVLSGTASAVANTTAYLSFLYHGFTGTHLSSRAVSVIWSWWIWPMFTAPSVRSFFMPGRSSRVALLPGTFAKMRAQRVGLLQQNQRRPCPFAQRRQRLRRCHQLHRCRRIPRLACRRPLAQSCLSASPPLSPNCIRASPSRCRRCPRTLPQPFAGRIVPMHHLLHVT